MKNTIHSKADTRVFRGTFPVETTTVESKTKVEAGDIIGRDTSGNFGKYDKSTYTDIYGVAYEGIESPGDVFVILAGGLTKNFVKLQSNDYLEIATLRTLGIFIK